MENSKPSRERIRIDVTIEWSPDRPWHSIERQDLPEEPGVYEVYDAASDVDAPALHIGLSKNLRNRIWDMIQNRTHSTASRIHEQEDISKLLVRWALTDRPKAVEEELHRLHVEFHGSLPTHDLQT